MKQIVLAMVFVLLAGAGRGCGAGAECAAAGELSGDAHRCGRETSAM